LCPACLRLIGLCNGLDFFPRGDDAVVGMLSRKLHTYTRGDHKLAGRIIDRWLDTSPAAPKAADLLRLAMEFESQARQDIPAGCPLCSNGEPWVMGPKGMTRCGCPKGAALKAMDRNGRVI
jgi:hypothetical protein